MHAQYPTEHHVLYLSMCPLHASNVCPSDVVSPSPDWVCLLKRQHRKNFISMGKCHHSSVTKVNVQGIFRIWSGPGFEIYILYVTWRVCSPAEGHATQEENTRHGVVAVVSIFIYLLTLNEPIASWCEVFWGFEILTWCSPDFVALWLTSLTEFRMVNRPWFYYDD